MKIGKGIVKKYSREYHRTLKNGERKKYTTQQIQITVPKTEDIYNNKEKVLIIPENEIENFNCREEENDALKVANYLYVEEVRKLEKEIENSTSNLEYEKKIKKLENEINNKNDALEKIESKFESLHEYNIEDLRKEIESIRDKHSKLIVENENLKSKYVNMKGENENLKNKYSSIKEENKNLKNKYADLREEQANIKDSYNKITDKYDNLKHENMNMKTSYAEIYELNETLRNDYNNLVDRYNDLEEEFYVLKSNKSHDEYIANKVKEFILKSKH